MALALNNLKRVGMPLNKETKPNQTKPNHFCLMDFRSLLGPKFPTTDTWEVGREFVNRGPFFSPRSLSIIPVGFTPPPFRWILRAFSFVSVCSWYSMNSGLLARWNHLVFPSVPSFQVSTSLYPVAIQSIPESQRTGLKSEEGNYLIRNWYSP